MRTQDEIVARIEEREKDDFFGFERRAYMRYLDYEHIKPYLKKDIESDWQPSAEPVRDRMIAYMSFAWEKANHCRGISASRSISRYTAWLWLAGDNELWKEIGDYEYYGKPQLRRICEYLSLDADQWDDGVRVNDDY